MNWWNVFDLALTLLEGILGKLGVSGATVEQLEDAQAALASLRQFHGTDVTKAQMESLKG